MSRVAASAEELSLKMNEFDVGGGAVAGIAVGFDADGPVLREKGGY
jgi:hypothetical protein